MTAVQEEELRREQQQGARERSWRRRGQGGAAGSEKGSPPAAPERPPWSRDPLAAQGEPGVLKVHAVLCDCAALIGKQATDNVNFGSQMGNLWFYSFHVYFGFESMNFADR